MLLFQGWHLGRPRLEKSGQNRETGNWAVSRSNQHTELEQAGSERHLLEIKSQFPVHWHLDHTGILPTTLKQEGGLHEIIWFDSFILLRWELRPRKQRGPPEVPGLAGAGQTLEPCFSTSRQMHYGPGWLPHSQHTSGLHSTFQAGE